MTSGFFLTLTFLLAALDLGPTGLRIGLALVFILLCLCGIYCARQHWIALRDHEIGTGGTLKTARRKWRLLYPPID